MKYRLTKFAHALDGQPMFKVLAQVKAMQREGKDVIHFEIGDPDFNTPENIIDAAVDALRTGKTHYAPSGGLHELKVAIQNTTEKTRGFTPSLEQILVVPGVNIGIFYAVSCLVEPGDEVIVPDPGFPTYYSVIKACGAVPVRVQLKEENAFRMDPADVRKLMTDKTRLIIMNSPQNPTGAVMSKEAVAEMAAIAKEHDVYLYSDEVYARMCFAKGSEFSSPSFLDQCKERTIVANGFSKTFAMTGWRIGAMIGPEDVISKMELLLQTTSSCTNTFIQYAAIEAIQGDQGAVKTMVEEYRERMRVLVDGLNSIQGITCLEPAGAIYIFPNISGTGMTSDEFATFALEKAGVAVLPGTNFGEHGEGYIRMCVVSSRDDIEKGVQRLKKAIEEK